MSSFLTLDNYIYLTKKNNEKLIQNAKGIKYEVVETLPETGDVYTLYLLKNEKTPSNMYDEYLYVNDKWEQFSSSNTIKKIYKDGNSLMIEMSNGDVINAGDVVDADLEAQIKDIQDNYDTFFQLGCDFKQAISDAITAKDSNVVLQNPQNLNKEAFVNAISSITTAGGGSGGSSGGLPISPLSSAEIISARSLSNGTIRFSVIVDTSNSQANYDGIEIYVLNQPEVTKTSGTLIYSGKPIDNNIKVSIESLYPYPENAGPYTLNMTGGCQIFHFPENKNQLEIYFAIYTYRSYGDSKEYTENPIILQTVKADYTDETNKHLVYSIINEIRYFTSSCTFTFPQYYNENECITYFAVGGGGGSELRSGGGGGGHTNKNILLITNEKNMSITIGGSDSCSSIYYANNAIYAFRGCRPSQTSTSYYPGGAGGSGGGGYCSGTETGSSASGIGGYGGSNGCDGNSAYIGTEYGGGKGQIVSTIFNGTEYSGGGGGGANATSNWYYNHNGGSCGGNGGRYYNSSKYTAPSDGKPNTGGGAGGGGSNKTYTPGKSGGSGIVILKYGG